MTTLAPDTCRTVAEKLIAQMNKSYIFPEPAAEFEAALRAKLDTDYQTVRDVHALARQLTADLQSVTHDRHLRVEYQPEFYEKLAALPENATDDDDDDLDEQYFHAGKHQNFGFERVERLIGNVGYVRLNGFHGAGYAGETAIAAMNFVANTRAVIFDLRANGGGSPSMVQLLTSYLFERPKHLNSFYTRHSDKYDQFWTQAYVPGKRLSQVPVYVLTSARTFSAAEEFTYNLKQMKRATIMGETTGGGAHPITPKALADGFIVALCEARAVNPISGTNWEGTGIEPDIALPAAEAFKQAHLHALETLLEKTTSDDDKKQLQWDVETVRALYQPITLPPELLQQYTGAYDRYTIQVSATGGLTYSQRGFVGELRPLSETVFADTMFEDRRFEFVNSQELRLTFRDRADVITIPRNGASS
jgi:retinol-binding protein 3